MIKTPKHKFIEGDFEYDTEASEVLLTKYDPEIPSRRAGYQTLFKTKNGAFFICNHYRTGELIPYFNFYLQSRESAQWFLTNNREAYIKAFGEPKEG